jgi:hypothetical protein
LRMDAEKGFRGWSAPFVQTLSWSRSATFRKA